MQIITIDNFKLGLFRSMMEQSLVVNKQLIFRIDKDMIKSCSFSPTKSLIKLITMPTERLSDGIINDFVAFDVFIFRGDVFKKYLSVYKDGLVNITFTTIEHEGKIIAKQIKIIDESGLETVFAPTTEKMMSDSVSDYSSLIEKITPKPDMFRLLVANNHILNIRQLIGTLHNADPKNVLYLCFEYDKTNNNLSVKDSVFKQSIPFTNEVNDILPTVDFMFNVMKTDYIRIGNHNYSIYTKHDSKELILIAAHGGMLVSCLITKVDENVAQTDLGSSELDGMGLSAEDIANYF